MKRIALLLLLSATLYAASPFRCPYTVTSEFGSMEGRGGERRPCGHTGIDLWCPDPYIGPAADGVVVEADIDEIYGKYIIIQHTPTMRTKYAHGEIIYDRALPGCTVTRSMVIMKMGNTGYSSNDHLHFEVQELIDGEWVAVDPIPLLTENNP